MAMNFLQPFVEGLLPREVLQLLQHIRRQRLPAAGGALPECAMNAVRDISYLQHARHAFSMRDMHCTCQRCRSDSEDPSGARWCSDELPPGSHAA